MHAGSRGLPEEWQHDRRRVGVAYGRNQVDAVGAVEGGGVGAGFVPVECDRVRAGDVEGATAGGFDAWPEADSCAAVRLPAVPVASMTKVVPVVVIGCSW